MTIELKLIPNGLPKVPAEAKDNDIVAGHLAEAASIPDSITAPIDGWRDVVRVTPGHGRHIAIRVPGERPDYPGNSLSNIASSLTDNIDGLKEHPNGWESVDEPQL